MPSWLSCVALSPAATQRMNEIVSASFHTGEVSHALSPSSQVPQLSGLPGNGWEIWRRLPPSRSMTNTAECLIGSAPLSISRVNSSFVPSGDHCGAERGAIAFCPSLATWARAGPVPASSKGSSIRRPPASST